MSTNINDIGPAAPQSLRSGLGAARRRKTIQPGRIVVLAMLVLGALVMLLPFLWLLSTSLKNQQQIFLYPPQWIPAPVRWQNYPEALTQLPSRATH